MSYSRSIRIPAARIGVLIGRKGSTKKAIEEACGVSVRVDSRSGEVAIESSAGDVLTAQPFKAAEIVTAIGRGFSEGNAMLLTDDRFRLHVMDLREFAGKSGSSLERIRGRVIGENGRARRNIEQLSRSHISVYGKTVSIIGEENRLRAVVSAVNSLLTGGMHAAAYGRLEAANRRERMDRMLLWEGQQIGE
ncbi:MAG: RNA-binding protein [Nitrosopumilaceae archaeon]|nr:RNA-binding protein [Nitrosopumilaceae archaeon]